MARLHYLNPATGPVVEGLEDHEQIYALSQGEYLPIRTLPAEDGRSAIYRVTLTPEQRQVIVRGGDILVEIMHFGGALSPSRVMVLDSLVLTQWEESSFKKWFAACTKAPYLEKLVP